MFIPLAISNDAFVCLSECGENSRSSDLFTQDADDADEHGKAAAKQRAGMIIEGYFRK
jgi:hypothetical protein